MVRLASGLLMGLLLLTIVPLRAPAYAPIDDQVSELESQVAELRNQVAQRTVRVQSHPTEGAALFLFGAFCALWAQNTGRNPWLWFFMGMIFSVITVIVLLSKNAGDLRRMRQKPAVDPFDG